MKIDAHHHLWDLEWFTYPWLHADLAPLYRTFTPPDLAPHLRACGVDATVVVQATHDERETAWLLELARTTPWIAGVVGWVDLRAADLDDRLDRFAAQGPLCGVRHQVHDETDAAWLLRPDVLRGLRTVARRGMVYDLLVRPQHLPLLPRVFAAVPNGRWVIDHLAKPLIKSGTLDLWRTDLERTASYPNVYCKLSGLITEADHRHWTIDDVRPYVAHALHVFGPERMLWGSDWPVCLLAGSYDRVHDLIKELIAELPVNQQAAIWGATAQSVYRLER